MGLPPDWTKYGADGEAEYIMEGIAAALQK